MEGRRVATTSIHPKPYVDDTTGVNMWLVFLGPPGAGKGTQSERLIEYIDATHVSTGEILRDAVESGSNEGHQVEQYLAAGGLVPDPLIIQIFARHLASLNGDDNILFDGFPRTLPQAEALDRLLEERGTPVNGVFYMQVDSEELLRRLAGRGRNDDRVDVIRHRLEVFSKQTEPLIERYEELGLLHVIDGVGTEDEVFARIKVGIEKIRQQKAENESESS